VPRISFMSASHAPQKDSVVLIGSDPAVAKPLAPPHYRQHALRTVLIRSRGDGVDALSMSELVTQLRDRSLRDHIDPAFEPLSIQSIDAAVTDLVHARELRVDGRNVVLTAPHSPVR